MKKLTTNDRINQDKPIEIWEDVRAGWKWKVWKFYKRGTYLEQREKTIADKYGRVLVSAQSPFTHGGWEMGDSYYNDIRQNARLVYTCDTVTRVEKRG